MSETETAPEPANADPSPDADPRVEGEPDRASTDEATPSDAEATAADAADEATPDEAAEKKRRRLKRALIQTAVVLLLPAIAFFGLAYDKARKVDILLDNGFPFPVKLFVNGKELATIPRLETRIAKNVPGGTVKLKAVEQGPAGEQGREFVLSSEVKTAMFSKQRQTYVWNIGGSTEHYWVIVKDYDNPKAPNAQQTEKLTFDQDLFPLPEGFLPQLNAGFPKASQVEQGGKRKMLWTSAYVGRILANRAAAAMMGSGKLRGKLIPK